MKHITETIEQLGVKVHACESSCLLSQGAGTAIGELPPYFMARAARQSGADPDDEDYEEFEEMLEQAEGAQVRDAQTCTCKCSADQTCPL